ncbi:MAG TPA: rhodanese-like domain-containing protein [Solirubrobacteraceae bacterium]|jgi:hydroxyacylglutathione hydrolase/adenylyltransferase/sulfurtransferase
MGGESQADTIELDPAGVEQRLRDGDVQVIDVRESSEREAGYIEGSRHIELARLSEQASAVAREQPVVFYCRVGARSQMAAQAFRAAGYEAYSMLGGLRRWAQEDRPLSPAGGTVADH